MEILTPREVGSAAALVHSRAAIEVLPAGGVGRAATLVHS